MRPFYDSEELEWKQLQVIDFFCAQTLIKQNYFVQSVKTYLHSTQDLSMRIKNRINSFKLLVRKNPEFFKYQAERALFRNNIEQLKAIINQ